MTRDEALLWLNDRLGKSVHVSVQVTRGDSDVWVVYGEGELLHWRSVPGAERQAEVPRDDLAGWYVAGTTRFDLTDLDQDTKIRIGPDAATLVISLSDAVTVEIVEQSDFVSS